VCSNNGDPDYVTDATVSTQDDVSSGTVGLRYLIEPEIKEPA